MSTADGTIKGITKIVDHGVDAQRYNIVILAEGYQDAELATFTADAQQFATTLASTSPFSTLWAAINVHAVSIASTDSGAVDPLTCGDGTVGTQPTAHTYFDAKFCGDGNIHRLLTVDTASAATVAQAQLGLAPGVIFVIVNSTTYGGSGATGVAVFSKAPNAAQQVGMHEMGHAAYGLADEYGTYAGCTSGESGHDTYTGTEPTEPNVTSTLSPLKWQSLVTAGAAIPTSTNADCTKCDPQASPVAAGTVGAFAGARYFHCGIYRPEFDCRMRNVDGTAQFCAVCRATISAKITPFLPAVGITSFTPTSGDPAGGTDVVITGTGFTGATGVMFGSVAASFNVDSDTQITAISPPGTGSVSLSVTSPAQPVPLTLAQQFTYGGAVPAVTGISPGTGSAGGGDSVVIAGSGFTGATSVGFGATGAAAFNVDSDTQITTTSPAGTGTVDVTVVTPGGTSSTSAADQFTYQAAVAAAPTVTGINPATGAEAGGDSVVITGSGFTGATSVGFGSTGAPSLNVDSDTQITTTSPPGTGTVDVTVTTSAGTSATSAADQFTYQAAAQSQSAPAVTGISPNTGAEAGGDSVVITGSGFTGATSVGFGSTGASSLNVDSDTQITTTSPAGTGTVDVTVTTPAGTSATSGGDQFTYQPAAQSQSAPTVTAISPNTGAEAGGDSVVITGSGFTGATSVGFASTGASTLNVDSDTQITTTSPAGTGTVDVTVTTPAGTSATSGDDQFTYQPAAQSQSAPTVTAISPNTGAEAGGDSVVVTGSGFTGATSVGFGSTGASSLSVDSDTQITTASPAGTGTVDVTVTTPAGTSATSGDDQFTYQ